MKIPWRFLSLFALATLTVLSTAPAWAALCGDASGPSGTDIPCACGDTVVTDTTLNSSDPVVFDGHCSPVGLFVAGNVRLDAHSLNLQCGPPPPAPSNFSVGIWIVGDSVEILHGIVRDCTLGVFGFTSGSRVERVTASDSIVPLPIIFASGIGIFLIGNHNELRNNLCHSNTDVGLLVSGNFNELDRNYCRGNDRDGIVVLGSANNLTRNRGQNNGGHGVFVNGGANTTDGLNFGSGNGLKPDCSIDGVSTTPDGRFC